VLGWTPAATGSFIALLTLVNLAATLAVGPLARMGLPLIPGLLAAFGIFGVSAGALFWGQHGDGASVLLSVIVMVAFGLMPGLVFVAVPRIAPDPARAAMTYGGIAQFGNLGTFSGTPLFAYAFGEAGWAGGVAFVAAVTLAGVAASLALGLALRRGATA
jgi:hypothetical protein